MYNTQYVATAAFIKTDLQAKLPFIVPHLVYLTDLRACGHQCPMVMISQGDMRNIYSYNYLFGYMF